MTKMTSLTLAALVAVAVAGSAMPTLAQSADHRGDDRRMVFRHHDGDGPRLRMRQMHRGGPGAVLALACSERGGDRLEHMLLNIKQRTDVTTEQQPLFDAFHDAALEAQSDFAAACAAARPAADERTSLDLAQRFELRLEIQKAHVAALEKLMPAFTEFYGSLTDEQKSALEPRRRAHRRDFGEVRSDPEALGAPEETSALIGLIGS